ncbi:MAG TPA: sigma-70 family RNA polymerase sigma factor [Candidatus Limnocylindrales bacterium]|jgi:RNA polymerase sigma-70 factor (ECF subfamily)
MSDARLEPAVAPGTPAVVGDEELLAGLAAGRLEALDALYERYKTMAYGIARRITGDDSLAEDVVQEAFLGAWRSADRYVTGRGSVKTWLLAIVHHRAIDAVRRRRPASELPEEAEGMRTPEPLTLPDVWGEVSGRLDATAVQSALAALPALQRQALELAYFGGLTQTEMAARLDVPLGTVKSRVRLALVSMRRELGLSVSPGLDAGEASP